MYVDQAVKDVSTSYDAIVDLLESIEHFMDRLDIYTRVPSTGAMTEILVKIMVELISTLALVTKQIKQKRPSKCVPIDMPLSELQYSEAGKEAVRRGVRGGVTKVGSTHPG